MPMLDKVRIDNKIKDLVDVLRTIPGVTLEGASNQRIKVTKDSQSCFLPAKYIGHSHDAEIKRSLKTINIILNGEGLPGGKIKTDIVVDDGPDITGNGKEFFGFELSDGTINLLMGLMASYREDFGNAVERTIDDAVEHTVKTLGEQEDWKQIATDHEQTIAKLKRERTDEVRSLVEQRNAERTRAENAEAELAAVRKSLEVLGDLLSTDPS